MEQFGYNGNLTNAIEKAKMIEETIKNIKAHFKEHHEDLINECISYCKQVDNAELAIALKEDMKNMNCYFDMTELIQSVEFNEPFSIVEKRYWIYLNELAESVKVMLWYWKELKKPKELRIMEQLAKEGNSLAEFMVKNFERLGL